MEAIRKRGYTLVGDVHPAEADEVAGRLHARTWRCWLAHGSDADEEHGQGSTARGVKV